MASVRRSLVVVLLVMLIGCTAQQLRVMTAALDGQTAARGEVTKLMLFGGRNNKQYLGCLSCDQYELDSIYNSTGLYGNRFNAESIWNTSGIYGSHYSIYSPWNTYGSNPPVVVDQNGNFYGYFTVNKFHPKRVNIPWIVVLLDAAEAAQQ